MRRLVLFAKLPRLGQVKTRLAVALGEDGALALYRAFLADQLALLRSLSLEYQVEACLDGRWRPDPELDRFVDRLRLTRQGPGDLGTRLLRCFERSWGEGARSTLVLGADAPTLPAARVREAFRALDGPAVAAVLVPAADGGYVALGLVRPLAELLRDIPWGGPQVSAVTVERARAARIELQVLEPWFDVDDGAGLARLRSELGRPGGAGRAPATAAALARLDSLYGPVV